MEMVYIGQLNQSVNSAGFYLRDEIFHKDWKWMFYEEYNINP